MAKLELTEQKINEIAKRLKSKPVVVKTVSQRDAIQALSKEIKGLIEKGYSWEAVAEILQEEGIKLAPSTLKSYVVSKAGKDTPPAHTKKENRIGTASPESERTEEDNSIGTVSLIDQEIDEDDSQRTVIVTGKNKSKGETGKLRGEFTTPPDLNDI